jgi:para-aminobenzoate synthetase component 2
MSDSAKILVVDNYDSFVYTIVGYLKTLGATVTVYRNDAITSENLAELVEAADGVLISPGPGTPQEAGCSEEVIRECAAQGKPMLGVCLGLQALAEVYGATVDHAPTIMHGKTSQIEHEEGGLFEGVPNPMTATRYHSLAVEPSTVPDSLKVIAQTSDHIVQGLKHRELPLYSVQFHPESVMTQGGYRLFANWLEMCGQTNAVEKSVGLVPNVSAAAEKSL